MNLKVLIKKGKIKAANRQCSATKKTESLTAFKKDNHVQTRKILLAVIGEGAINNIEKSLGNV